MHLTEPPPGIGSGECSATARDAAFEPVEVVADGHGEGEQCVESLLRWGKLDGDAAGFESHPGGQVLKVLIDDGGSRFDQQLGLSEPLLPEGADQAGHLPPPLDLVRGVLAGGDALEMCDQGVAIGEPAGPDAIDDAASEDLLSASAADAEQKLELSAGDTGAGIGSKFLQNMGQITIPAGFSGHGGGTLSLTLI